LLASATEWIDSASSAEDPVTIDEFGDRDPDVGEQRGHDRSGAVAVPAIVDHRLSTYLRRPPSPRLTRAA